MDLDAQVQEAVERVHWHVDTWDIKARAETAAMAESARRSIGQRFRRLREELSVAGDQTPRSR